MTSSLINKISFCDAEKFLLSFRGFETGLFPIRMSVTGPGRVTLMLGEKRDVDLEETIYWSLTVTPLEILDTQRGEKERRLLASSSSFSA